jgi:thiamine-phosphate pyrophosphorylase
MAGGGGKAVDGGPAVAPTECRLYLVTPPRFDPAALRDPLAAALDAGDVACVQLRLKDADDDTVRRAIDVLRPVVQSRDVAFILNDRPDLAAATGCDGVHVGQDDMPYAQARKIVGRDAIVGVTCHDSRHLAMDAGEAGADYVAFGAFFPTGTKATEHRAEIDILQWWAEIFEVPCVAIGGITPANCGPLVAAGVDFLAVVSAVWDHPDGPAAAVRAFADAITAAREGLVPAVGTA